jgi:hypothetical protein
MPLNKAEERGFHKWRSFRPDVLLLLFPLVLVVVLVLVIGPLFLQPGTNKDPISTTTTRAIRIGRIARGQTRDGSMRTTAANTLDSQELKTEIANER